MNTKRDTLIQSLTFLRSSVMMLEGSMSYKCQEWDTTDIADARDAQAILRNLIDTFEKRLKETKDD